jgi:hypothetical protein
MRAPSPALQFRIDVAHHGPMVTRSQGACNALQGFGTCHVSRATTLCSHQILQEIAALGGFVSTPDGRSMVKADIVREVLGEFVEDRAQGRVGNPPIARPRKGSGPISIA